MRPSSVFHASWAAVVTLPKSQPELSVCQFDRALSALTYEMPILAWTTVLANATYTAVGVPSERLMICDELNGWSKMTSKWTVYSCRWPSLTASPQKWPLVSEPVTSLPFTICAVLGANSPFWLSCSLIRNPAWAAAG